MRLLQGARLNPDWESRLAGELFARPPSTREARKGNRLTAWGNNLLRSNP